MAGIRGCSDWLVVALAISLHPTGEDPPPDLEGPLPAAVDPDSDGPLAQAGGLAHLPVGEAVGHHPPELLTLRRQLLEDAAGQVGALLAGELLERREGVDDQRVFGQVDHVAPAEG